MVHYAIKRFWRLHYSVTNDDSFERAWRYALWLLGRQAYSQAQLVERLRRKRTPEAVIDQVVKKLASYNYLDDAAYAELVVRSKRRSHGRMALKRTLRQKGVAEQLIDQALGGLSAEQEREVACALLQKQAWRFQGADPRKNYAKAYAYLARRGFTPEVIRWALEHGGLGMPDDEGG